MRRNQRYCLQLLIAFLRAGRSRSAIEKAELLIQYGVLLVKKTVYNTQYSTRSDDADEWKPPWLLCSLLPQQTPVC